MLANRQDLTWRLAAGVIGALVGSLLPIPLGALIGAALATASVNVQQGTGFEAPVWLRTAVQLMLGGLIGSLLGPALLDPSVLPLALLISLITLGMWLAGSYVVSRVTGVDLITAMMVSAPGSTAETTAAASDAGMRAPLVAAIQLGRVLAVLAVAVLLTRIF